MFSALHLIIDLLGTIRDRFFPRAKLSKLFQKIPILPRVSIVTITVPIERFSPIRSPDSSAATGQRLDDRVEIACRKST